MGPIVTVVSLAVTLVLGTVSSDSALSCDYKLLRPSLKNDGYLMSPNYPELYSPGTCLTWIYYGRPGMRISIRLLDIDIPSFSASCNNDFLMIGPNNEQTYCGSSENKNFELFEAQLTSQQYWLYVAFNSTNVGTKGRGFKLYYNFNNPLDVSSRNTTVNLLSTASSTAHPRVNSAQNITDIPKYRITATENPVDNLSDKCTFQISDQSGEISSDSLISSMHNTGYCSWFLYMPGTDGHKVIYTLNFEIFKLSQNSVFRVFDGANMSAPSLGKFSFLMRPFSVTSSQNKVFMHYVPGITSQSTRSADIFTVKYSAYVNCELEYEPCGYGEFSCFQEGNRCDGVWHCPLHGGDERGCTAACPTNFSCDLRSSNCYAENDRCNGKGTCSNYMDEMGCNEDKCSSSKGLYLCRNGRCIYEKWKCDRMNHCFDNSDETDCSALSSPLVIVAAVIGSLLCALLLVIAVGCVCKVYHTRARQLRGGPHHETPLSRQLAEMFYHRAPPPPYHEAMLTSRPYDEAYLELLGQTEHHLEASGVSNDHSANISPPRERAQRNNRERSRRCRRHNQRHPDLNLNQHQFRSETERLTEVEASPLLLEGSDDNVQRQGMSSTGSVNNSEPPPYSECDPSNTAGSCCSDSEDESENETWSRGVENTGYTGDDDSHASVDRESVIQLEVISSTNRRLSNHTSVSSGLCLRSSNGIRTGPERNFENNDEEGDKDGDNASTSLSADSSRMAVQEDNSKFRPGVSIIGKDSDSDCILDGNNADDTGDDDGEDTDSDSPCILDHV